MNWRRNTALIHPVDLDAGNGRLSHEIVFQLQSSQEWEETQVLLGDDADFGDDFGASASISGTTIAIGANRDDDLARDAGAVYVFTHESAGTWQQQTKLTAGIGGAGDCFGFSVDARGDVIAVGAFSHDSSASLTDSGAAYVFERNHGGQDNWGRVQPTPSDETLNARFGHAVAISPDRVRIVVGAPSDVFDEPEDANRGSAYEDGLPRFGTRNDLLEQRSGGHELRQPL